MSARLSKGRVEPGRAVIPGRARTEGTAALPPGPSAPAAVQTVRWLWRPVPFLEDCRRRFGETFTLRISRAGELVLISDPPSIKRVFSADRENRIPAGRNLVLEPVMGPRSILLLEGEEHLRRRKLMLPPFHGERMRAYEAAITEVTESEVASWLEGEAFPLHPRMQAITLEVILSAVFGVDDPVRRERLRALLVRVLSLSQSGLAQVVGLLTRPLGRFGPYRRFQRALDETDAVLADEISERRSDPELGRREDILSLLVGARDEAGAGLDDGEIRDQLITLLLAGHETTATALAWAFDLLFRHPAAMDRLRGEVESDGTSYLDAVAEETLRLRPVIPMVGRKLARPAELGGHELPAGAVAMPCIYLVHTRPDLYEEPYAFRPERFLDGGPDTYSWIPFGGGRRRCLGAAFALFEMRVVLRTVLGQAELRPATAEPEPIARRNITLSPRNGTPAIVTRRRRA